ATDESGGDSASGERSIEPNPLVAMQKVHDRITFSVRRRKQHKRLARQVAPPQPARSACSGAHHDGSVDIGSFEQLQEHGGIFLNETYLELRMKRSQLQ